MPPDVLAWLQDELKDVEALKSVSKRKGMHKWVMSCKTVPAPGCKQLNGMDLKPYSESEQLWLQLISR